MKTYHGSCHCGAVRYEVDMDLHQVTRCNCSICRKKGIVLARAEPENLRIVQGKETLKLYQFNHGIAKHFFCPVCGIHTFANPRAAPDKFVINVNTLDDYDIDVQKPQLKLFDGKNWEAAFARQRV